jgi:Methyltransferase domain
MNDVVDEHEHHEMNAISRKIAFLRPYSMGLVSAIGLFGAGWITSKGRARIVDMCRSLGYHHDRRVKPVIPIAKADSIAPESQAVRIINLDAVDGNVTERELVIISRIVAARNPSFIFEIGTFDGRTTSNLAVNCSDEAKVFTLDLPADSIVDLATPLDWREQSYALKSQSGTRYRGTSVEKKITQLYGDSATFDFSPYFEQMNFVFVDGSHAFPYVMADSLNALRMLRDSGGVIVWHDYARWDGVTAALNKLSRERPEFASLRWIEGTTLAVFEKESR